MSNENTDTVDRLILAVQKLVPREPALAAIIRATRKSSETCGQTNAFSGPEFHCLLTSDYEDGLFFVPAALRFIDDTQPGYGDVCSHLADYVGIWQERLTRNGVFRLILEELCNVFWRWNRQFQAYTSVNRTVAGTLSCHCSEYEPAPFDLLLEAAKKIRLADSRRCLLDALFQEWIEVPGRPARSACFLDFAFRVRCCPSSLKLHTEPIVLDAVFNRAILHAHYESCAEIIRRTCGDEYVSLLERGVVYA